MQTNSWKRIAAITKESTEVYRNRKRLILLLASLPIGVGMIYMLLIARSIKPGDNNEVEQLIGGRSTLALLEDSLSASNQHILQLNALIDQQMRAENDEVEASTQDQIKQISDTNKQLIIKKIEAILKYLKTPLNQFNQLPAYFINNAILEQEIKSYNNELMALQRAYKEKSQYDTSYFRPLERSRDHLIEKLTAEKQVLLKSSRRPQAKKKRAQQASETLIAMFNARDSVTEVYSGQLQRYQKQLNRMQLSDLMDSLTKSPSQRVETSTFKGGDPSNTARKWLFGSFLSLIAVGILPFFTVFYKKYKSPLIQRVEDIAFPPGAKNIVMALNKNVNQELIAFNYEYLVKSVEHLAPKPAILSFYSVDAQQNQDVISLQLASLLAELGNKVLHMDMSNQPKRRTIENEYTYDLNEFAQHATTIKDRLFHAVAMQAQGLTTIKIINTPQRNEKLQVSRSGISGSPQDIFTKTASRDLLTSFKEHFDYVLISTPDFLVDGSPLLNLSQKDINIHVFKAGVSKRRSANLLCKLNDNDLAPSLGVIDFATRMEPRENKKRSCPD